MSDPGVPAPQTEVDRQLKIAEMIMRLCRRTFGNVIDTPDWFIDALKEIELAAAVRPSETPDSILAIIVQDLGTQGLPWRELDVDDRNALISKWRKLWRREPR